MGSLSIHSAVQTPVREARRVTYLSIQQERHEVLA
jgi:hypothetical protein